MKEYDLYIPLFMNDGRPIDASMVSRIKAKLVQQFGGLTFFPQENEGVWKFGGITFRDKVVILRVLSDDEAIARKFFATFRPELQECLDQESILIVERDVRLVG